MLHKSLQNEFSLQREQSIKDQKFIDDIIGKDQAPEPSATVEFQGDTSYVK